MPGRVDHVVRDAKDAAFHEIAVALGQYRRRLVEGAYIEIEQTLTDAEGEVDGTQIGREAARRSLAGYLSPGTPAQAVEAPVAAIDTYTQGS